MFKKITGIIFFVLIIVNIGLFVSSIKLGDDIAMYERNIQKIHEQNIGLQKEVARFDSLQYAASEAATLNFIKQQTPVYLDNLKYAQNR